MLSSAAVATNSALYRLPAGTHCKLLASFWQCLLPYFQAAARQAYHGCASQTWRPLAALTLPPQTLIRFVYIYLNHMDMGFLKAKKGLLAQAFVSP
jgi:hypothetical protein